MDTDFEDGIVRREVARQGFRTPAEKLRFVRRRADALRGERWLTQVVHRDGSVSDNENERRSRIRAYERFNPNRD